MYGGGGDGEELGEGDGGKLGGGGEGKELEKETEKN